MLEVRFLSYRIQTADGKFCHQLKQSDRIAKVIRLTVEEFNWKLFRQSVVVRYEDDLLEANCFVEFPFVLLNVSIMNDADVAMHVEIPVLKFMWHSDDDDNYGPPFREMDIGHLKGWKAANAGLFAYERQQSSGLRHRIRERNPRETGFGGHVLRPYHVPKHLQMMKQLRKQEKNR